MSQTSKTKLGDLLYNITEEEGKEILEVLQKLSENELSEISLNDLVLRKSTREAIKSNLKEKAF